MGLATRVKQQGDTQTLAGWEGGKWQVKHHGHLNVRSNLVCTCDQKKEHVEGVRHLQVRQTRGHMETVCRSEGLV